MISLPALVAFASITTASIAAAAAASASASNAAVSVAEDEVFEAQCVERMKTDGRLAFLVGGVCRCVSEKTAAAPELRAEFLSLTALPQNEREAKMSPALRDVREACAPFQAR